MVRLVAIIWMLAMSAQNNIWNRITELGSEADMSQVDLSVLGRSNHLSLILFVFSSLFFSISFLKQEFTWAVVLLLAAFLFVSVLVFNALRFSQFSRLMLSFGALPLMIIPVFSFGRMYAENFFVWQYAIIAVAAFPLLVLNRKTQIATLVLSLFFNTALLLGMQFFIATIGSSFILVTGDSATFYWPPYFNFFTITIVGYALLDRYLFKDEMLENSAPNISKSLAIEDIGIVGFLERIKTITQAQRVSIYREDENGNLSLAQSVSGEKELPNLSKTISLMDNMDYQDVLSLKNKVIFNCVLDSRTRDFYSEHDHKEVLAAYEFPFYKRLGSAGVLRCEISANKAFLSNDVLKRVEGIVLEYVDQHYSNGEKSLSESQRFIEQKQLILEQNKELKTQREELEYALDSQKDTQQELAKKEAEARSLLKSISDHNYVFEYNRRGEIIWLNEKSLELFGMTLEQVRGMNWSEFDLSFVKSEKLEFNLGQSFWRDLLNGKSIKRETRVAVKGSETWVAATFLPILNEKGKPIRILGIAQDITDIHNQRIRIKEQNELLSEKQAEILRINNELEQRVEDRTQELNSKNEQLVEYTYINAHMLRAPVCNILGLVELLDGSSLEKENKDVVNYLHKAAFELDDIVNKINETLRQGYKLDRKEWKSKANQAILQKET